LPLYKTNTCFKAKALDGSGDIEVPTCTLDSLIEKYGPFDVLKMDCEGCEYDSIPYSKKLTDFKEILIEYIMVMKYWRKSSKKMDSTYNIQGLL
jgi:FkbM family methyltransferase